MRPRKRGPKRMQGVSSDASLFFLQGKITVRDAAGFLGVSYGTAHERIRRGIGRLAEKDRPKAFRWNGSKVVLVLDALWLRCNGERWTIYFVLARHTGESEARIASCGACAGSESYAGWNQAIASIPSEVRAATIGVTSDGQKGIQLAVHRLMPSAAHQRCQFHVLADLLRRLGKRTVGTEDGTKRCWDIARLILRMDDPFIREKCYKLIISLAHPLSTSKRTRRAIRWFCRIAEQATVAHGVLDHDIPFTTGSAEAMCKRMRRVLEQIRPTSPQQIQRAIDVFVQLHPSVHCKGVFPAIGLIRTHTEHNNDRNDLI